MLKTLALTVCGSLLAFAGSAFAQQQGSSKEKIICHHGALATFQIEADWNKGTATISERGQGKWVPVYKGAAAVRGNDKIAFLAEGTPDNAVSDKSNACGRVDQTLSFDIQNVNGKRQGTASRSFRFRGGKNCKVKAPPPDMSDYAISLKCK